MEPSEEVLVVIQAESGEEIALPLAALDEQHQEVILDSDGTPSVISSHDNINNGAVDSNTINGTADVGVSETDGDTEEANNSHTTSLSPIKKPPILRQKQRRKEKLVCLPLFEDDNKLEFQVIDQQVSPVQEVTKRKPRKEYRTKRRLAALGAMKESEPSEKVIIDNAQPEPSPKQQPPERRTRLSNSCRVATGNSYRCQDCDFSTERINNIISHLKETCPKKNKNKSN